MIKGLLAKFEESNEKINKIKIESYKFSKKYTDDKFDDFKLMIGNMIDIDKDLIEELNTRKQIPKGVTS